MTQEELKQYKELNEKFENDCDRVCGILSGSKKRGDICYADKFRIKEERVWWEGFEYFRGDPEWYSGSFPSNFLTTSDDELAEIVKKENEEFDREVERKNQERAEREKAARLAEYEKLRKEFGYDY